MATESTRSAPVALLAAATLASVVFGDYAHEVGKWAVCLHSALKAASEPCKALPTAHGLMLGTLLSTFVAMFSAALAGLKGEKNSRQAALIIFGAFAGALFALLKAAADEVGYPDPAILFRPLLIYLVCACVAAAPFALLQWEHFDRRDALALTARIAIALILAAALGTALQLAAELAWQGSEDRTSARKFVIAPVAAVMAGAVVATVIAEPWLGQGRALRRWAALCLTVAACAALAFVFVGYLAKHGDGWLANSGAVGIGHAPAVLLALLMGGLVVTALAVVAGRPEGVRRRIAWSALPAAGLGLFVGHAAGRLRIAAEAMLEADLWLLAMTHAAAAATVALTVLLTDMTYRRLALYLRGRC